jgi:ABC-type lipoprotein release transport system permease subunit
MILAIGWKNIWRNKTRSLVVIVAVMLGIFGGVMATGIMQGWIEQRVHSSIYTEVSHVQIHNPDFMYNEEIQYTINNYEKVTGILDTMRSVVTYSPRVKLFAMAKSSWASSGFVLKGIDPEKEKKVSEVYKNLIEGEFFEENHRRPSIVIGSKTAENLKLLNYQVTEEKIASMNQEEYSLELIQKIQQIGSKRFRKEKDFKNALQKTLTKGEFRDYSSKLVKYFSFYRTGTNIELTIQDKNGVITHPVFKVRGIYKTDNSVFDAMNAFVNRKQLNRYTGLNNSEVHEIAILATDNETGVEVAKRLEKYLPEQDVLSWRRLSPEIAMYTDFSYVMAYIYVGIILFALAFGVINTMLMSVLERIKELGMLMAIGMNKKRVFNMIMLESIFLTLTGAVAGMIFSGIIVQILSRTGINFEMWSEGFEALGYSAIVYPSVTWFNYVIITAMVIATGMISSIWPARKALKLNPVEALRTE